MSILKFPLATEKSVALISRNNTITYIVHQGSKKGEVKREFERLYGVKVESVNIVNTPKNEKKAYIRLAKGYEASNIAMKLKLV